MTTVKEQILARWWCTLLISALWRQRQVNRCEFKASLVYRVSSRTAGATQKDPVLKHPPPPKKKKKLKPNQTNPKINKQQQQNYIQFSSIGAGPQSLTYSHVLPS